MIQLSHTQILKKSQLWWTFVSKVMSLPFNTLSRFVIAFLPRSKHFLTSWLQSLSTVILKPKKIKSVTAPTFPPSICYAVLGLDAMILVFWMLSFKPAFSLSSFSFIKRLFSSSSLSAIRVAPSAYLRLLIFLPAILIPACASASPAFLMMYPAYKLNKQSGNIRTCHTLSQFGTSQLFHEHLRDFGGNLNSGLLFILRNYCFILLKMIMFIVDTF